MSRRPIQPGIHSTGAETDSDEERRRAIREALSYWASGVAVLAVTDGDELDAITVSAFSAVSVDPPLLLVCLHENASALPMVLEEERFTVSILPESGRRIASVVAGRAPLGTVPFARVGDPVLEGAIVSFVCQLWEAYPGGDHRIVVGEVERIEYGAEEGPLLYYRREYRGVGRSSRK